MKNKAGVNGVSLFYQLTMKEFKMKLLLQVILLLSVSLPVLADEVKLVCKMADGSNIKFSFHTEEGYYDEENKSCTTRREKDPDLACTYTLVTDMVVKKTNFGKGLYVERLDRIDGTISHYLGSNDQDGKCAPFKQAF